MNEMRRQRRFFSEGIRRRDQSAGITATPLQNELLILDRKLDQEIRWCDHWNR
jgi:hypothetical protein